MNLDVVCRDSSTWDGAGSYFGITDFLAIVHQVVLRDGWTSAGASRNTGAIATKDIAWNAYERRRRGALLKGDKDLAPTRQAREAAQSAITAILALADKTERSDYEEKLYRLVKFGMMEYRNIGLVASGILYHFRPLWQAEKTETATTTSQHVGTVGQRQEFKSARLQQFMPVNSPFGLSYLCKFIDQSGSYLTWFATNPGNLVLQAEYNITGTVKQHTTFNGVAETQLTRCKTVLA